MQEEKNTCYHCGEPCNELIVFNDHKFCCHGCRQVYQLLSENDLCTYYDLSKSPGIHAKGQFRSNRFAYLDDESVLVQLAQFRSDAQVNISFSLPQVHCTSCIFLLENLHRIDNGILSSRVNFERKEILVSYNPSLTGLRKIVELMAFVGYEPAIRLNDGTVVQKKFDRKRIIQLGVAGFCFSNIMMLSFPDYLSGGNVGINNLQATFTWIIFGLSIPVLIYSAQPIFVSAWKSLRQGIINIDAPIALASLITFGRSYFEIITGTGSGYLDSGTGIIFFMLIGRWFQAKTYDAIAFDRDYKSYFPLGATLLRDHKEENIPVARLQSGDIILIRNEEMIPADAVLLEGEAAIDYSFVSGESNPVVKKAGSIVYAGGKQKGKMLRLKIVKAPSQSYITQLWNNDDAGKAKHKETSFIHPWSRYFTLALFSIAFITAVYWNFTDPSKLWPAVTAVLIVACPCSLLLSATFTMGHMQRIFGQNKLYLKNATVIESLAGIQHIVFDKTGTLTRKGSSYIQYYGQPLNKEEETKVSMAAAHSSHPLSKAIYGYLLEGEQEENLVNGFRETAGGGLSAVLGETDVQLGSASFVGEQDTAKQGAQSVVYVKLSGVCKGYYEIGNEYRPGIGNTINKLKKKGYILHVLSGDNDAEKQHLQQLFGPGCSIHFNATPAGKLSYINTLKESGGKVLMIGDGLNDAGALLAADCGIAVSDDATRFSPACDAIIDGGQLNKIHSFLGFSKWNRRIILAGFILSILYNIAGISFAVQAELSPLTAAILMPSSSISIVLLAWALTAGIASRYGLISKADDSHAAG